MSFLDAARDAKDGDDAVLRIGLGCMRLSTEPDRDEPRGIATIRAAFDGGIRVFDTARSYCLDDDDRGHNERLLAKALTAAEAAHVRIVTKGGMRRPQGYWIVDGRAKQIVEDCEASVKALAHLPIDLYLLHVPDNAVPLATSVNALVSLLQRGLVKHVGLSNVNRSQLDEALALGAPIEAVEVELSWWKHTPLTGGVVARCIDRDITVIAHRPLGGAKKKRVDKVLGELAKKHNATKEQAALAAVLDLDPHVVVMPGPSTPATAAACAASARIHLDDDDRALTKIARALIRGAGIPADLVDAEAGEVVLLMGIQGAGKTDALESWLQRGYERINRDARGGTMRDLHKFLDERLASGLLRVVLDNTYVTRSVRREAIEIAWKHRLPVRGVWFDTPLLSAQVNVVLRMLQHHGRLLEPEEMAEIGGPTALPPHAQHRLARTLEAAAADEGFSALDVVAFRRRPWPGKHAARFVSIDALAHPAGAAATVVGEERRLVYAWMPSPELEQQARAAGVDVVACRHPAGPPVCWCRPPMPGLLLQWALANDVDPSNSVVVGPGAAHRKIAEAIGAAHIDTGDGSDDNDDDAGVADANAD